MILLKSSTTGHMIIYSYAFGNYGFSLENDYVHDWDIVAVKRFPYIYPRL